MRRRLFAMLGVLSIAFGTLGTSTARPASAYDLTESVGFIRAVTDPPLPSWVRLSTGYGNNWGFWVTANVGPQTVCFGSVPGYVTPPCQTVSVAAGATTTVTGTFTALASLRVVTSPPVASAITVDGVVRNNWGAWFPTARGPHTVCWGPVAGYDPPPCQNVSAPAGATTVLTGVFTPNAAATGAADVGYLRVTTSPPSPVVLSVNGEARDMWGLNWMEMPPGPVRVCAIDVGDFVSDYPADCEHIEVVAGQTAEVVVTTHRYGSIRVTTQPALPSTISIDGADADDWGAWPSVTPGLHTVCFSKVAGFAKPNCKDVTVGAGQVVDVVGTFGPAVNNVSRFAGTGTSGTSGDGGPALDAQLATPWGIARGADGSIYVSDPTAGRVRRVAPDGTITTVAGCTCPYADNVPATTAQLLNPSGLALDASGNLYIADAGFGLVRRVNHTTGIMTTVAGNRQAWTDPVPENVPATAAPLGDPMALAFDGSGNLYILATGMHRIRKVDTSGLVSTFAGTGSPVTGIGDGGLAVNASVNQAFSMAIRGADLYFTDAALGRVRKISLVTNVITTVAGSGPVSPLTLDPHDGSAATSINMDLVAGVAVDAAGNLYVGDVGRIRVRRVDAQTGVMTTVFDGTDQVPYASDQFTSGSIHEALNIAIIGQDLVVTFSGDHLVRRVAGVVPAGP